MTIVITTTAFAHKKKGMPYLDPACLLLVLRDLGQVLSSQDSVGFDLRRSPCPVLHQLLSPNHVRPSDINGSMKGRQKTGTYVTLRTPNRPCLNFLKKTEKM